MVVFAARARRSEGLPFRLGYLAYRILHRILTGLPIRFGSFSAGLLVSLGNRLLLRLPLPTERQILLWDRVLVRLSRRLDAVTGYRWGKSVLGVWRIATDSREKRAADAGGASELRTGRPSPA